MKVVRFILVTLALSLALATPSSAQRTMRGQFFVDATAAWQPGARLGMGQYVLPGYWEAGVEALVIRKALSQGGAVLDAHLDIWQAKACGGYMFRLASTRGRALSLYAGGEGWVGLEMTDPFHSLPDDIVLTMDMDNGFVFGVTPALEAELFLGSHAALVLGGRVPVALMSRIRMFSYQGYAGLRIAF